MLGFDLYICSRLMVFSERKWEPSFLKGVGEQEDADTAAPGSLTACVPTGIPRRIQPKQRGPPGWREEATTSTAEGQRRRHALLS
eukprot:9497945-Pyramimonas_sp.AAC.1